MWPVICADASVDVEDEPEQVEQDSGLGE